ncbi:MAG TPA: hypothetical protein VJ888_04225, partial [Mobilitalea sp.]|nr:hypothetical protein [Mobilitalea sp.]
GNKMSYNGLTVTLSQGISNGHSLDIDADNDIGERLLSKSIYLSGSGFSSSYSVNQLDSLYSKMTHLLYIDSNRAYQETDKAVGSSVIPTGMSSISSYMVKYPELQYYSTSSTTKELYASDIDLNKQSCIIVDGDATLYNNFNGVLIASGNITIKDDVNVNGMVVSIGTTSLTGGNITLNNRVIVNGRLVATGDISLGTGDKITATDAAVDDINNIFTDYGEVLSKLFANAEMTINYSLDQPAGVLVDMSALISYENWRKN